VQYKDQLPTLQTLQTLQDIFISAATSKCFQDIFNKEFLSKATSLLSVSLYNKTNMFLNSYKMNLM
jgi:hypothetical protein